MVGYVLKRILLVIPTMFIVMIIAFFLSKIVPGDAAESMLVLQGINLDGPNAQKEYQRNYSFLGLDKPTFYFSLTPDFYPANVNHILSQSKRQQTKSFLLQKFNYKDIKDYFELRDSLFDQQPNLQNDSAKILYSNRTELLFDTNPDKIKKILQTLTSDPLTDHVDLLIKLEKSVDKMIMNKSNFYYPKINWHGFDNQFHQWATNILTGNFGVSLKDGRMVGDKISGALKWTFLLIFLNIFFTTLIAVPAGLYAGYSEGSWFDKISSFFWILLYAIPVFWLASLLIVYCTSDQYGRWMDLFPVPGIWYIPEGQSFVQSLAHFSGQLVLPVICLIANDIAQLSRITRNNVIELKSKLYITYARSKGLDQWQILKNHILPNALLPLITVIGGRIPAGISGSLIIEIIFNIPGMGRLIYESIFSADWNVVFSILLVISIFTILFMLLTDIVYIAVHPKIKSAMA